MEKKTEPGSTADKKSKEDEDILELAEEMLNRSDDEIIGLDEDAVVTADEDDEVIDLTEVSDTPLTDEDEILDLTEELQQSEPEDDITIAEDDEIMELEDITDVSADTEVAILELDEAIDALAEPKQEILTPEEAAKESEEPIIDLRDTVEAGEEPAPAAPAFAIETDTIELSESDRETLEQEFGFETEDEGLPAGEPVAEPPADGGLLAGTLDQDLADTIEMTDTADEVVDNSLAQQPAEIPEEPLVLTDEDRATLEEEIGGDTIEEIGVDLEETSEPLPMEEDAAAALQDQLQGLPDEPPELPAADTLESELRLDGPVLTPEEIDAGQPEQEPADESEIRFDAEELSMGGGAEEPPISIGIDPEEPATESAPDALQQPMELADMNGEALQAEFARDAAEPPPEEISVEPEVDEEILDVGLDLSQPIMPEEPAAEEADASLAVEGLGLNDEPTVEIEEPGGIETEDFSTEPATDAAQEEAPLTAEALTDPDIGLDSEVGATADRPSGTTFDPEEDEPAAVGVAGAEANGMSVDFDQTENFEQSDLHKDADPISIRVKEPATEDHADEDALLNKVFEPPLEAESPQELEQTVERVVGKMLSEKIEGLLADAIEKAVEKEIGRLKKLLLEDLNRLE